MALASTTRWMGALARTKYAALSLYSATRLPAVLTALLLLQRHPSRGNDVYNILWAVVFGFATLNILSLAARRFEPNRRGLTFGELMAVLIVLLSIFLLGWELLGVFHIFPIKLQR
ncbi:MAG: hypothetical protein WAU50_02205 [Candidatus Sulfotelmatobacter sp.]